MEDLSKALGVSIAELLTGDLRENENTSANMKKMHFYVCPDCGNLITSMTSAAVSCCGKKLQMIRLRKADDSEKLSVEIIENEYFISSDHEMSRNHYISFVGLLTGDCMMLRKQYPEWDLQLRIPVFAHGKLFWYCTQHGFFWQNV